MTEISHVFQSFCTSAAVQDGGKRLVTGKYIHSRTRACRLWCTYVCTHASCMHANACSRRQQAVQCIESSVCMLFLANYSSQPMDTVFGTASTPAVYGSIYMADYTLAVSWQPIARSSTCPLDYW